MRQGLGNTLKNKGYISNCCQVIKKMSTLRCFLVARLEDETHGCPNDGHNFRYQGKGINKLCPNALTPQCVIRIYGLWNTQILNLVCKQVALLLLRTHLLPETCDPHPHWVQFLEVHLLSLLFLAAPLGPGPARVGLPNVPKVGHCPLARRYVRTCILASLFLSNLITILILYDYTIFKFYSRLSLFSDSGFTFGS